MSAAESLNGRRLCALLVLALSAGVSLQSGLAQQRPRTAIGGDRLRSVRDSLGRRTTVLEGHVRIARDDVVAESDTAFHYEWRGAYSLHGSVHVTSDSLELWSRRLHLSETSGLGRAVGDVRLRTVDGALGSSWRALYQQDENWFALMDGARVIDGALVVSADSIHFDRRDGTMEAFGGVRVVDEETQTVITGEHGSFDRRKGLAVVDSLPELVSRRQGSEITEVQSDWMEFDRAAGRSTAVGRVHFRQGATLAEADTAHFYGETELFLSGSPSVDRDRRVITGERIRLLYEAKRIRQMDVYGHARLVDATPDTLGLEFRNMPLANTLVGDTLHIYLEHGEVSRTFVNGHAKSVYVPEDQSRTVSVNEVSGRTVDIRFRDGEVYSVGVEHGVVGRYRFYERPTASQDSAATDSLLAAAADSSGAAPTDSLNLSLVDFDAHAQEVQYQGNRTDFLVRRGRIHIQGGSQVRHGSLTLDSQDIYFDTNTREILAEGDPILVDNESKIVGNRMGYLFDPKTGAVSDGATRFQDDFYMGEHIRRIDKNTMLVRNGRYTTCDLAEPHYHFAAKRMKLTVGKRVVARQITLKVSDIPLITLPFYYKNLEKGRRSGILFPQVNVGVSSREGRYIRDLGYYWATNDYTDLKFLFDYNERRELTTQIGNRYNMRYGARGDVDFTYTRRFEQNGFQGDEWRLKAAHSQRELWDVWQASANLDFSSKDLTRNDLGSQATAQLLPTDLRSSASLGRRFGNGANLSLSFSRTQKVNAENKQDPTSDNTLYTQTLPSLSLSFRTLPLMSPLPGGRRGNPVLGILRDTQFSQSYRGSWNRDGKELTTSDDMAAAGNFGLNYAPPSVGPFKLSSSASFSDSYSYSRDAFDAAGDTVMGVWVDPDEVVKEESKNQLSLSLSNRIGTDIYGFFETRLGALRGMKHKISLGATHSLRPAIREQQTRSESIGLSMKQEFSFKILDRSKAAVEPVESSIEPGAEAEEEPTKKLDQVLIWDLSTSYTPEAPADRRWGTLSSRISLKSPVQQIRSIQITQSIDPYSFEFERTQISSGVGFGGSLQLGGKLTKLSEPKNPAIERLPAAVDSTAGQDGPLDADAEEFFEEEGGRDPWANPVALSAGDENALAWSLSSGLTYAQSRLSDGSKSVRSTVSVSGSARLPGSWSLMYSAGFDIETGEFTNQHYSISRELHQWQLEFARSVADGSDFSFRLYLRDIPDLEVRRGNRGTADMLSRLGRQ
jgi:lipopolysaccharide assembly outer membrane protein LptD (OstA)